VAKSEPDGHTILVAYTGPITVNPTLFGNLPTTRRRTSRRSRWR
jgi:hypothetical protein